MSADLDATIRAAEDWLDGHGLPWFVEGRRAAVRGQLSARRLVPVILVIVAAAVAVGVVTGLAADQTSLGIAWGETAFVALAVGWALVALHGSRFVGWAGRRALGSLGLLFPLVSRALPLLLLSTTFLFINTEVWQVASTLDRGVIWQAALVFAVIAIGFLLVRLPEELDEVDHDLTVDGVVDRCRRTPVEATARTEVSDDLLERHSDVVGLERANLVLVLLIAQAIQVLLLSLAVWVFFLVFGAVTIKDRVIESWIERPPRYVGWGDVVSVELVQVSTFLAAFAGLYFTVYAVSDGNYRQQFFTAIRRELERAVSVRVVYRSLLDARRRDATRS